MKTSRTTKLFFLALFILPNVILAQNQTIRAKGTQIQISSTLQTMLRQAEAVYVPSGYTMDVIYNDAPDMAPLFLGLIMQRQEIYMNQIRNVNHLKNNTALHGEILTFIGELAKAHNYINPVDGSKLSPIDMHKDFKSALNGNYNNVYINKFGINPTTANVAYLLDRLPNPNNFGNTGEHAKIDVAEAPTEINLFGEVSGAAESLNPISNKEFANTFAEPEKPQKKSVVKGVILGRWTGFHFYNPSDKGEPRPKEYVTFSRGSGRALKHGKEIYRGKAANGTHYYIISEKQVDQHTMAYETYVDYPETLTKKGEYAWRYRECDGNKFTFEVESTLIRNKGSKEYRIGFKLWLSPCNKFVTLNHLIK